MSCHTKKAAKGDLWTTEALCCRQAGVQAVRILKRLLRIGGSSGHHNWSRCALETKALIELPNTLKHAGGYSGSP